MAKLQSLAIGFGLVLLMHSVYSLVELKQYSKDGIAFIPKDILIEAIVGAFIVMWYYAPTARDLKNIRGHQHYHDKTYEELHRRANFRNYYSNRAALVVNSDIPEPN